MDIPIHILTYQTAQIIVLMSYERYVAICKPFIYKAKFTSQYRRKYYLAMIIGLLLLLVAYIADIYLTTYQLERDYEAYHVSHCDFLSNHKGTTINNPIKK